MIIHKNLFNFLEKIYIKNMDFTNIKECELKTYFKNNEYYLLKNFCIEYKLINIEYHKINLTKNGVSLFNILKK